MTVKLEPQLLHFDLSAHSQEHEFTLLAGGGRRFPLKRYVDHPGKLDEHLHTRLHFLKLGGCKTERLTHFVEEAHMNAQRATIRRVIFPSLDDHPLPEIAQVFLHTPRAHVEVAVRRLQRVGICPRAHMNAVHFGLGVEEYEDHFASLSAQEQAETIADWNATSSPGQTAVAIALHHPELGSIQPGVMEIVRQTSLNPLQNQDMQDLVTFLENTQPGSGTYTWYNKSWSKWAENPQETDPAKVRWVDAEANTELKFKDDKTPDWPTPNGGSAPGLPSYGLTDEYDPPQGNPANEGVVDAAGPAVRGALLDAKNNVALAGQLWNAQQGVTNVSTGTTAAPGPGPFSAPKAAAAAAKAPARTAASFAATASSAASGFATKNLTSLYGLYTYPLSFDNTSKKLTVPVKNWPSRYLGAYVQFLKEDGTPLKQSELSTKVNGKDEKWPDTMPFGLDFLKPLVENSDTKNYLTWLSSGNAIFGAPVPPLTQRSDLEFPWPDQASRALMMFGGLGVAAGFSDWDTSVDLVGTLGTGIVNFGIGGIMLVADVYIINPLIDLLQREWGFAFYVVAFFIGAPLLLVGVVERENSAGKAILSKLGGIAASAAFGALSNKVIGEEAAKYLVKWNTGIGETTAEIASEEALEEVPIAGWALRVASVAADIASLAATTIEVLTSPATYEMQIQRTMNVTVTVGPDPTHGKKHDAPVWPVVADHWICQVKYPGANGTEGGTTYTMAGPLEGGSAGDQVIEFKDIPAGGKIEVVFGVYSDTNWMAGQWNSGWIDAVPDDNDALAVSGAIKEILVPLTASTTYSQKRTIGYTDTAKHYWIDVGFAVDSTLTPDFDKGGGPDSAIQTAFADNGNTLTAQATIQVNTAGQSWTMTDNGLGAVFAVTQKQIYSGQVFTMSASTYTADLDKGGAPDSAVQSVFQSNIMPLPDGGVITVVTAGQKWTIAAPGQPPVYELSVSGSDINVLNTLYELEVANTAQAVPSLPESYPRSAPTGHKTGDLLNIVHNNHEFQLGYAYLASGQNMPFAGSNAVSQDAMYAMQSISTLGSPEEQIYTPKVGYTASSFIAYDQFGLTPLFVLPDSFQSELTDGPVPADLVKQFADFGHTLPSGAVIVTITAGKDWSIGVAGKTPLFEIRVTQTTKDSKTINQLSIYDYPVPRLDNFFFEPQPKQTGQPVQFHLRGVDLAKPPGQYTFDITSPDIWGIFTNASASVNEAPFQEVAVHPNGYAVALDNLNGKLFVLKLPADAVAADKAPYAMPLSGLGSRQGLVDGPQAMNVTADGRILVLETGTTYIKSPRIQAFDTKGNPVPSFSVDQPSMSIANAESYVTDFDAVTVSQDLLNQFQQNFEETLAPKVTLTDATGAPTVLADLDNGKVDETLIDALAQAGLAKVGSSDPSKNTQPSDFTVRVTEAGKLWYMTDSTTQATYDIRTETDGWGQTLEVFMAFSLTITLRSQGVEWQISDSTNAETYSAKYDEKTKAMTIQRLISYMPLRSQQVTGTLSYLDLSTETKGYIYVLSVINNKYNTTKDPDDLTFQLDIYAPDGSPLLTEPQSGINAGKITVDQYRTLYTLNFDAFVGPDSRTEPGVSQWAPSTPNG